MNYKIAEVTVNGKHLKMDADQRRNMTTIAGNFFEYMGFIPTEPIKVELDFNAEGNVKEMRIVSGLERVMEPRYMQRRAKLGLEE